ncbi:MAG: hypothetical protein EBW68_11540, partial [Actinobacteria bacterium]|nr:hypothetical protein [Actinomycetota bacterium]
MCQAGPNGNYRIALEWCAPIRLEYQEPGSSAWNAVAIARNLGDLEGYLEANNRQVRIRIKPDHVRQMLVVEVGDNGVLRHTPRRNKRGVTLLPDYQRYDLYG